MILTDDGRELAHLVLQGWCATGRGSRSGQDKKHGGLTYEALAKEYGVSISVISEIIKGTAWREEQCVIANLSLFPSATDQLGKAKDHPLAG
jgi:hypothetical protein